MTINEALWRAIPGVKLASKFRVEHISNAWADGLIWNEDWFEAEYIDNYYYLDLLNLSLAIQL